MATHTTEDKSTDVYGDKREDTAAAAVVVVAHHSTAERGPSRPRYGGAAASTSCPCPTTGLGGDYVERLEGEVISVCGAGGVCEAINENWLAACRIKDQLQPKSPPRRIYNPLCCGLGSFGFNLIG